MASDRNEFSVSWFGGPLWAKRLTSDLDRDERQNLETISRHRQYRKGQTILAAGTVPEQIVVIETGTAEICAADAAGRNRSVEAGEVLGMTEILAHAKYRSTLTATSDCEIKVIRRDDLITYLQNTPSACYRSLEVIADRLESGWQRAFKNV